MTNSRTLLVAMSLKYNGDWDKIYNGLKDKVKLSDQEIKDAEEYLTIYSAITILDDIYPEALKNIYKPPFVLYYKGNINLLKETNILGVSGSRKISDAGNSGCIKVIQELGKSNVTMVNGLALGIDATATMTALQNNIPVIGVVAQSVDIEYPEANIDLYHKIIDSHGLILSEYPSWINPAPEHFKERDRIIAGLSKVLFVPQVRAKSGTLFTINLALSYGKNIGVLPMSIEEHDLLNNQLIKQGATIILDGKDIEELLKEV